MRVNLLQSIKTTAPLEGVLSTPFKWDIGPYPHTGLEMAYLGHWLPPASISWGTSRSTSILGSRQRWLKHKAALFSVLPAIWNHSGVCGARDKPGNGLRAERSLINVFDCGQHCTGAGYTNQKLFHMFLIHLVRQAGITPSSRHQGWTDPAQMWWFDAL